jgi:hypothetical protein
MSNESDGMDVPVEAQLEFKRRMAVHDYSPIFFGRTTCIVRDGEWIRFPEDVEPSSGLTAEDQLILNNIGHLWKIMRESKQYNADDTAGIKAALIMIERIVAHHCVKHLFFNFPEM